MSSDSKTLNIIHFSDLHFGRIQDQVLNDLDEYLQDNQDLINLVILTGDLTQRAKKEQFIAAKVFLSKKQSSCVCRTRESRCSIV